EIMSKFDQDADRKDKPARPVNPVGGYRPTAPSPRRTWSLPKSWRRFSAGQYFAAAFATAFIAVVVRNISAPLATLLVLLSIVLFFAPIILYRSTGTTT